MELFVGSFDVCSVDCVDVLDGVFGCGVGGVVRVLGYGRGRGASREDLVCYVMEIRNMVG